MKSSTICQDWVDSLPTTRGCLKKEQSLGRELLLEQGIPSNKDEAWRLCNFNRLNSFLSLPTIIKSEDVKSKFPDKDKNRERIIINSNRNQFENIDLSNGIQKLNDREIEESLSKIVKSTNVKNDFSVCLNQASSLELLALKVRRDFNKSLEIVIPSIKEKSISTRIYLLVEETGIDISENKFFKLGNFFQIPNRIKSQIYIYGVNILSSDVKKKFKSDEIESVSIKSLKQIINLTKKGKFCTAVPCAAMVLVKKHLMALLNV